MLKSILFSLIILGSFTSFSQEKNSDIQKLFKLMQSDKLINQSFDNVIDMVKKMANEAGSSSAEDSIKMNNYFDFIMEEGRAMAQKMMLDMEDVYANHFSKKDIKNMIAFYSTETGQKLIEKTPVIQKDIYAIMMEKYMPEYQTKIMEKLEELRMEEETIIEE